MFIKHNYHHHRRVFEILRGIVWYILRFRLKHCYATQWYRYWYWVLLSLLARCQYYWILATLIDIVLTLCNTRQSVAKCRFRPAGHILCLPDHRLSETAMRWTSARGTRRRGRPKKMWRRTFQDDMGLVHLMWNMAEIAASDQSYWQKCARL